MKLLKLLQEIISESQLMGLNEYEATWYEESRYIQELANPEMAYILDLNLLYLGSSKFYDYPAWEVH